MCRVMTFAFFAASSLVASGAAGARDCVAVVEAHAGDCVECLGTVTLLKDRGWDVQIVDLTAPTNAAEAAKRADERAAACRTLGATGRCLGWPEGDLYAEFEHSRALVKLFEEIKPTVIFTHWSLDANLDHAVTAGLVTKAALNAPSLKDRVQLVFFECPGSSRNFAPGAYVYMNQVRDRKDAVAKCFTGTPCGRAAKKFAGFGHPQLGTYPPRDVETPSTIRGLETWQPARQAEAFSTFDFFRWGGTPVGKARLPFYVELSQAPAADGKEASR